MKKERHIVMCVGLTHSGKTTFAKKLIKEHPNAVLIDNDEIATFVNTKYPSAAFSEYNNIKRNFKEPNLKFLLFRDLLEFSMKCEVPFVLSNGNLGNDIRTLVSKLAKKYSYKLIVVYFNLSKDVIIERIAKTTNLIKSIDSSRIMPETDAPSTLRTPISLVRCMVENRDKPKRPKEAIKMAKPPNMPNAAPNKLSFLYWSL